MTRHSSPFLFQHCARLSSSVVGWCAAIFILTSIDRVTKIIAPFAFGQSRIVIPSFVELRFVGNTQLFFLQRIPQTVIIGLIILIMIPVAILCIDAVLARDKVAIAYSLILLGAWSNLWDRVAYGMVIDFIHVFEWFAFNIADMFISGGVLFWILVNTFLHNHDKAIPTHY